MQAKSLQDSLDGDDQAKVLSLATEAAKSDCVELRQHAVEALGLCGKSAVSQLASCLDDVDEGVAQVAVSQFSQALDDFENDELKLAAVEDVFQAVRNRESLNFLASTFTAADSGKAVSALLRIITAESPNAAGVQAAKAAYREVTGEAYTTPEAAEAWLKENYTPPEAD